MTRAAVFAGQGSQTAQMGAELIAQQPRAQGVYQEASELLGVDILGFSETDLLQTRQAQIAIVVRSLAEWFAQEEAERQLWAALAGFSLGEYSALAAAGVLSFADLLRLVDRRAELMDEAAHRYPGTMFAILGLDNAVIEQLCAEPKYAGKVWPVNYNAPGQVVISGLAEPTAECAADLLAAGARRALPLKVGGAFHTPLMADAAKELAAFARTLSFAPAAFPLYGNLDAAAAPAARDWPAYLAQHMRSPVRWAETVSNLSSAGVQVWQEFGPGAVLSGLIRKIIPGAAIA